VVVQRVAESEARAVETAVVQLRELLGPDPDLLRLLDLPPDLSLLRDYLTRTLRAGLASAEHTRDVAVVLERVDSAIRDRLARRIAASTGQVGGLSRAVRAIGNANGARLSEVVTRELCGALGYGKAMFSLVSGSSWAPVAVSVHPRLAGEFDPFIAAVDGHRISLWDAPREAELVRRRRPYAVDRSDVYRHTYLPLLNLTRSISYLAVPVVVGERAVAIMHVDRHDSDIADEDFHVVGALAEACALATESARLRDQIARQNQRAESELERLALALRDLERSDVTLDDVAEHAVDAECASGESPGPERATTLSARERDVLALIATGASNAAISHRLCISDGTVKSHLQRIFKKLGVTTRAEAAARYAGYRTSTSVSA
jgi:DNA-binding CsgD family transcriptional regulator